MHYLIISLLSFAGGLVQSVTGFGSGIVIMMALPYVFSMNIAPAISGAICTPLPYSIAWRYRKSADYRKIIFPSICYLICSTAAISIGKHINMNSLKPFFGAFLVLLSLYFMFFSKKFTVKGGPLAAILCAGLSGILSGFFGIGGPMLTIYFLAVTKEKEEYLGCINALFAITSTYQFLLRLFSGILTLEYLPYIFAGMLTILLGRVLGSKIVDRLNGEQLKKIIYIFLMFAGILTIVNSL